MTEWFKSWFDTEYYHLLYNKRNDAEARSFIEALFGYLSLSKGSLVADIACGKGRHSKVMAESGMTVHGYDLSCNSIDFANSQNWPHCRFSVHDMRQPYQEKNFDAAFNLFTSFGYFDSDSEDQAAIDHVYEMLKTGGLFVQDYLNTVPIIKNLPYEGAEIRDHLKFHISKNFDGCHIVKTIHFTDNGQSFQFNEKVKSYSPEQLQMLHKNAGFTPVAVFGDYRLQPFSLSESPRIIIVSKKS